MDNRKKLVKDMEGIAKNYIERFYTDFTDYDIPSILKADSDAVYIWHIRKTGTHLINTESTDFTNTNRAMAENNERFFRVDVKNGTLTELTREEAMKTPQRDVPYYIGNDVRWRFKADGDCFSIHRNGIHKRIKVADSDDGNIRLLKTVIKVKGGAKGLERKLCEITDGFGDTEALKKVLEHGFFKCKEA